MPVLPATRRHLVKDMRRQLDQGLAPVVVLRGPRQIGKTVAQQHLIEDMLNEGVEPNRILRVQFDELPEFSRIKSLLFRIVGWFEHDVLGQTLNGSAHKNRKAFLFFDEVQNLQGWDAQIKSLVDHSTVSVVVTGSSALRIERGRDSLAGRIASIEGGILSLTEIGAFAGLDLGKPVLGENGIDVLRSPEFWKILRSQGEALAPDRDEAFRRFSERGGYPLAQKTYEVPWGDVARQLTDTVVKRVIQHDLRLGDRGRRRDPDLLEEVFRLACRYAGQAPGPQLFVREAQRALGANVGVQRIRSYLNFLDESLLIRLVRPLELRLRRTRGNPKICLADHGLRASWLQEEIPLDPGQLRERPALTPLAGHIAESVVGAYLVGVSGLQLAHLPKRADDEPEVDFVLTVGDQRIPLEVKYKARIDPKRHTEGLRSFLKRTDNAHLGVLVTQTAVDMDVKGIVSLPLSSLLLLR